MRDPVLYETRLLASHSTRLAKLTQKIKCRLDVVVLCCEGLPRKDLVLFEGVVQVLCVISKNAYLKDVLPIVD